MRVAPIIALPILAALSALALATGAPAATIVTGTLPANPGGTVGTGQISIPGIGTNESRSFMFEWTGGALVAASLTHEVEFGYLYYDTFMEPPLLTGNEIMLIGDCVFSDAGANCNGPLVDGAITGNRITGRIITLPGFDDCATNIPAVGDPIRDCANRYDTLNAYFEANFDPDHDISYRLIIGDAVAVPEPAAWALMIGGFLLVGGELRRRRAAGKWQVAAA
jgi:hypothetical protein